MSEYSHYKEMREKNRVKLAALRRELGTATEKDHIWLAYSRYSPNVPGCHHPHGHSVNTLAVPRPKSEAAERVDIRA